MDFTFFGKCPVCKNAVAVRLCHVDRDEAHMSMPPLSEYAVLAHFVVARKTQIGGNCAGEGNTPLAIVKPPKRVIKKWLTASGFGVMLNPLFYLKGGKNDLCRNRPYCRFKDCTHTAGQDTAQTPEGAVPKVQERIYLGVPKRALCHSSARCRNRLPPVPWGRG